VGHSELVRGPDEARIAAGVEEQVIPGGIVAVLDHRCRLRHLRVGQPRSFLLTLEQERLEDEHLVGAGRPHSRRRSGKVLGSGCRVQRGNGDASWQLRGGELGDP